MNHGKIQIVKFDPVCSMLQVLVPPGGCAPQTEAGSRVQVSRAESGKLSGGSGRWNTFLERIRDKTTAARNMLMYQCGGSDCIHPRTSRAQWQSPVDEYRYP